ncbi:MAG: beta-propeller domain-containing protein [Oligoflexus sp.]
MKRQPLKHFIYLLLALGACTPKANNNKTSGYHPNLVKSFQLSMSTYESCEMLQEHINQQFASMRYYESQVHHGGVSRTMVDDMAPEMSTEEAASDNSSTGEGEASITNLQEKGVDEPDFVKRNDHHLYVMHSHQLEVLDRQTLNPLGQIKLEGFVDTNHHYIPPVTSFQVYAFANRLIIIGSTKKQEVKIHVYESAANQMPTLLANWQYSGKYVNSRLTQGKLYLVLHDYLDVQYEGSSPSDGSQTVTVTDAKVRDVPCQKIVKPSIDDMDFSLTKIASFDLGENVKEIDMVGVLGATSELYMSAKHIYVVKQGYRWVPWIAQAEIAMDSPVSSAMAAPSVETIVSKIRLDTAQGTFLPFAHGKVIGYPKNQWSFKELADGSLAVATTSSAPLTDIEEIPYRDNLQEGRNHLWLLADEGENLPVRSAIINFGEPGEDIRAVRYVDDKVYVVTFLNTDPLYSFDVSNSQEPKLLGQLKVPGFSTYLHPVADAPLMVGLGFDALEAGQGAAQQGLLLSLFDVQDAENMTRSDYRILGQRGSYSDATANHHAFFYEASQQWVGFPYVELVNPRDSSPWANGEQLQFSGAIVFQIADVANPASARLEEIARLSHQDFMPASCERLIRNGRWWSEKADSLDINRMFRHEDWLITVSRFGLKAYPFDGSFTEARSINFNHQSSCQNSQNGDAEIFPASEL